MFEVIKKIEEYKDGDNWDEVAGFSITTDQQVILLTIDNRSSCCESWGYFLTEDDTEKFIGATLTDLAITDTNRGAVKIVTSDYGIYDYNDPNIIDVYDGDVMFVDIVTDRGILQFVAYNIHNGYYGHEAKVSSLQLNYKTYL